MDDYERDPHLPLTPADIAWARAQGKPLPEDDGGDIRAICERDMERRMARINAGPAVSMVGAGYSSSPNKGHIDQYDRSVRAAVGEDTIERLNARYGDGAFGLPSYYEDDRDYLKDLAERIFFGMPLDAGDNDRLRTIAYEGLSVRVEEPCSEEE